MTMHTSHRHANTFVRTPLALALLVLGTAQAQTLYRTPNVDTLATKTAAVACAPAQVALSGFDATQVAPLAQTAFASRYAVRVVGGDTAKADGQTVVPLRLEITDARGNAIPSSMMVSIEALGATGGAGTSLDLPCEYDSSAQNWVHSRKVDQVKPIQSAVTLAENGVLSFGVKAPAFANTITLRIRAGDALINHTLVFTPELQDMVAAGLVELKLRKDLGKNANVLGLTDDDVFAKELRHLSRDFANGNGQASARGSMFLKGKIAGETLLTMAYDSEKEPRGRLLKDLDPNSFYPVYGDASTKGNDAPSDSKLYVRIDSGRSYALYGDFSTHRSAGKSGLAERKLGQYSRSLTGVKAHAEGELGFVEVFAAKDNQRQVVDEISGQGVSGPYTISTPNSLANTERVEIITRDRFNPAVVIDVKTQQRLVDYELDPFSQRLLFKQAVPSLDANFNPVSIRITYEVEQGGKDFLVSGAAAQIVLGKDVVISAGVAKDSNPVAPYQIASVAAGAQLGSKTSFNVEVAQSATTVNSSLNIATAIAPNPAFNGELTGKAVSAELKYAGDVIAARAYMGRSDETFYNPQSSLSAGKQEWVASVAAKVTDNITIKAQANQNRDLRTDGERQSAQIGVEAKLGQYLIVEVGARKVQETIPAGTGSSAAVGSFGSTQGYYGGVGLGTESAGAIDPATGLSIANAGFNSNSTGLTGQALDYTSARAKVTAVISPKSKASLEVEQDLDKGDRRLVTASADYQIAQDGTRVYARVENGQSWYAGSGLNGTQSGTFARVGLQTPWLGGDAYSEYRMRSAISGEEGEMAYGLKHAIKLSDSWRATTAVEAVKTVQALPGASKNKAYAVAVGTEYVGSATSKASARLELRTDAVVDNWLSTVSYASKVSPDWTWLSKNYYSASKAKASSGTDTMQDRFITGLAYRPVDTNQLNGLFKYEMRLEKNQSASGAASVNDVDRKIHIVGAHLDYHPSRPIWINARVANKWVKETIVGSPSSYSMSVLGLRTTYDVTDHLSLGVQGSLLKGQFGAYQRAIGVEAGYLVTQNVWATLGYNVRGYKDIDASVGMQTNKGWHLGLKYKFDEDVFSGGNAQVNKTLVP